MKIIGWLLAICLVGCGGGSPVQAVPIAQTVIPPVAAAPTVVFMGDSITQFWETGVLPDHPTASPTLEQRFQGATDVGIAGQTTDQMLARFDSDVISHHPDIVIILGGTNDMLRVANPTTDNIAAMAARAMAVGIHVVLCTLPPIERWSAGVTITDAATGNAAVAAFNQSLKTLASAYGYTLADYHVAMVLADGSANDALFEDGIHPNDAGYAVMAKVLASVL